MDTLEDLFRRLEQLNEIGAALSYERNLDRLLERILLAGMDQLHRDEISRPPSASLNCKITAGDVRSSYKDLLAGDPGYPGRKDIQRIYNALHCQEGRARKAAAPEQPRDPGCRRGPHDQGTCKDDQERRYRL